MYLQIAQIFMNLSRIQLKKILNKLELEQKIKDTLFEYKKNNLAYEVLFELKVKD